MQTTTQPKKKKHEAISVNIKTEYKQNAAGEYVITGLKIDSPRSVAQKAAPTQATDEDKEEKQKEKEEGVKAEEAAKDEAAEKKKAKKKSKKSTSESELRRNRTGAVEGGET